MALAVAAGPSTQLAVIGTVHTLATIETSKVCVLYVDLVNLAAAETVEIEVLAKQGAAGTYGAVNKSTFTGAGNGMAMTFPYPAFYGVRFTLKQTAGTGRNFEWHVVSL